MKLVGGEMIKGDVGVSSAGGPFAWDSAPNFGDYMIVHSSGGGDVAGWLDLVKTYHIDQIDFHYGAGTFIQGSMTFMTQGSAANFKNNISGPLKARGIQSGLHTYAYYIEPADTATLSDPKWQRQLGVVGKLTLSAPMTETDLRVNTNESAAGFAAFVGANWFTRGSVYLLIDQEIMRFTAAGGNSFTVQRARCGTARIAHSAGAEVKVLDGCFALLAPDPDSELFLQVARWTAEAYNNGGFEMIYLDAIDGMHHHVPPDEIWYYNAKFINEIVKYCRPDPIIEYSAMCPSMWLSRARMGAWDTPSLGYKEWNRRHLESNRSFMDRYLPTTMGWYSFSPVNDNTMGRIQYFDDIDHLGVLSIAYNMGIVFNPSPAGQNSAYVRNGTRYAEIYSTLRKENYFSESIKKIIRDTPEKEYAAEKNSTGGWSFFEKKYASVKLHDINAPGRSAITGVNPYETQQPFVRIEGHQSSGKKTGTMLLELDSGTDLKNQRLSASFDAMNIDAQRALRVTVTGNGSNDAICIRLSCITLTENSVADYLIRLDFEGEREFILSERDNGTFFDLCFPGKSDDNYAFMRAEFNYKQIAGIQVYLSGSCSGVKMSSIIATANTSNAISNPTIMIGGSSVTFNTTIGEGQYLEYIPDSVAAARYDGAGTASAITLTGEMPKIGSGSFVAEISSGISEMLVRATVTFGFTGPEVTDPEP